MSGIWISDAADRIDDGDAMALNHAVLQATIHGLRLDSLLVELLRSDHEIHRDVRDALARLIDAGETNEGKAKPVALKVECREKNVTGPVTRSQKGLYETRTGWIEIVRSRAVGETWAAWARRKRLSEGEVKDRRKYAEPILAQIRAKAPEMAKRTGLGLSVTERMLQDKLVWDSIASEKAAHRERNQTRKARGGG